MEKKFWWFLKKNEPENDFEEINNDYYGTQNSSTQNASDDVIDAYNDTTDGDVSVVLSGDPSKKAPLVKKTFSPLTCEDSAEIVECLKMGRVVIIDTESLPKEDFFRMFDYVMGAVHALDAELEKVTKNLVVLWPAGVDMSMDIDEIEDEPYEEYDEEEISEEEEA